MENQFYPFINLPLPYSYNELEPYIDEKTMELHHDKHLQTYINNLNAVLKEHPNLQGISLKGLICSRLRLSHDLQTIIRNNAGGIYNHRMFFQGLKNPSEQAPLGRLSIAINCQYGSYDSFMKVFVKEALSVFGSGYAWLIYDKGRLCITTTANQNSVIERKLKPIFVIDVWEHAYYLKHYNVRGDYINDWLKVINWTEAEKNYLKCIA